MPQLRKRPFVRQRPPNGLKPIDEVYHCTITNEIFTDYEQFFERVILCNSMVWNCSMTGRSGLTFQEALDCEAKARKKLNSFPDYLQKPILYIASMTHKSRLNDLNDDIFTFAKDHFFLNEVVDVVIQEERKSCRIMKVQPPKEKEESPKKDNNSDVICLDSDSDEEDNKPLKTLANEIESKPDASAYRYIVQDVKKNEVYVCTPDQISRKKGLYTREKSKLYLKQQCDSSGNGIWKVKDRLRKKYLTGLTWEQVFAGPLPKFEHQHAKKKPSTPGGSKAGSCIDLTGEDEAIREAKKEKKFKKQLEKAEKRKNKKAMKEMKQEVEAKIAEAEKIKSLSPEEMKKLKEELKEKKTQEKERHKEEMKKIKQDENQKKREEKLKEKLQKMEEKKQQEQDLKQWSRPREDMECDDLKPLPRPTPISLCIPSELFGTIVAVQEFLHFLEPLFDLEEGFPNGIDIEKLCVSVQGTEPDSLYTDLVQFLLTAIFSLQDEEEAETAGQVDEDLGSKTKTNSSFKELVEQATQAAQIPQQTFGTSLSKLHVDNFTLTEVLRLHFLGSGARSSDSNARFRYQQRGGFTSLDDAGLEFRRRESRLMQLLGETSLYDLEPEGKVAIIEALMQQLLTFAATRDLLEDNYDKLKQARSDLRSFQAHKNHREREESTFWYRKKLEDKAKEKELDAQKKEQKKKDREERLRLEEQGLPVPAHLLEEDKKDEEKEKEKDNESSNPSGEEHEVRKSARTKPKESPEEQQQREPEDWPATETIEWDKITPADRACYNEADTKKEAEIQDQISKLQQGNALYPIGRDRTFRRYWVFRSVPGLFVEDDEQYVPDDYLQLVPQLPSPSKAGEPDEKSASSDKENESFEEPVAGVNGTGENGSKKADININNASKDSNTTETNVEDVAEQVSNRGKVSWGYYSKPEEIDRLIKGLNSRGHREGPLRVALEEQRNRLVGMVAAPFSAKSPALREEEGGDMNGEQWKEIKMKRRSGHIKGDGADQFLELNLRDMLLDIEERIFAGGLGQLKVDSREKWRSCVEDGSYHQGAPDLTWSGKEEGVGSAPVREANTNGHEAMETDEATNDTTEGPQLVSPVVRCMAKALLQIKQMVEPRYLKPPMGEDEKTRARKQKEALELAFQGLTPRKIRAKVWDKKPRKGKKADDAGDSSDEDENENDDAESDAGPKKSTEERWEEMVMNSTSLSQLFLCLTVLENAVEWTKSAMNARCKTCRRKGQEDKMLLCDGCDRGYHMFCLKPPVKSIPKNDWFCADCKPKITAKKPRKHRKSFCEKEEEEVEDEEDEDSSEEDSDDSDSDDSDSDSDSDQDNTPPPAKIKFTPAPRKRGGQKRTIVYEDDEDDESSVGSRGNSRPGSRKGSRSNTPKRESKGGGRQSLEKGVMEKALLAKGKKGAAASKAPPTKKGRHSIETATPSVSKSSNRPSRRSLPSQKAAGDKPARPNKRKAEEQPEDAPSSKKSASTSSRRANDVMKTCEELLTEIIEKDEAWPFLTPVSKRDAPDYGDIVKTPMDLGTVRAKTNKFEYLTPGDMLRDIRLTFTNCIQYNMPQTAEYKAVQKLQRFFDKRCKELKLESCLKTPTKGSPAKKQNSPSATNGTSGASPKAAAASGGSRSRSTSASRPGSSAASNSRSRSGRRQ